MTSRSIEEHASLGPGDLVSAYRIRELLGSGGMGWVFVAIHTLTGQQVALKVLRDDQLDVPRAIDRMMREASILATTRHAGLPRFHECGLLADGRPWIAMELIDGISLGTRLANSPMAPSDVMSFVEHVAVVLAAAHRQGNTHRDIKPDNIFLTPRCPRFPVRLIDWGIAHREHSVRYTNHDEAIGTPTYMAPEQARGSDADGQSDVYGLGCVAYHALTGRPPFVGNSAVEVLVQHINKPAPALAPRSPDAPSGFVDLVERMLAKASTERPERRRRAHHARQAARVRECALRDPDGVVRCPTPDHPRTHREHRADPVAAPRALRGRGLPASGEVSDQVDVAGRSAATDDRDAIGSVNENVAPSPATLATSSVPPCATTMPLAIASPRPAPTFLVRPRR